MSVYLIRSAMFLIGWLFLYIGLTEKKPFGRSLACATGVLWVAGSVALPFSSGGY